MLIKLIDLLLEEQMIINAPIKHAPAFFIFHHLGQVSLILCKVNQILLIDVFKVIHVDLLYSLLLVGLVNDFIRRVVSVKQGIS
jgi:hypothetical protein